MKNRKPAVAGYFYPDKKERLLQAVDGYLGPSSVSPSRAVAVVSPHAGYVYSGPIAGGLFARVEIPRRVVVLGPKHRRQGANEAAAPPGAWHFPFGDVPIDEALTDLVIEEAGLVADHVAHAEEHSLEVQIPFLWRRNPAVELTAVALGVLGSDRLREIGQGLARAVKRIDEPVLIVASTDMSHHIPQAEAERLDQMAIQRMLALDADGLFKTVIENDISMCGVIPTTAAIHAAKDLGATDAALVRYGTSADVTYDKAQVVGYAGLVIR